MTNMWNLCTDGYRVPGIEKTVVEKSEFRMECDYETFICTSWEEKYDPIVTIEGGLPPVADECCQVEYTLYNTAHYYFNLCGKQNYKITSGCSVYDFEIACGNDVKATSTGVFGFKADIMVKIRDRIEENNYLSLHSSEDCTGDVLMIMNPTDKLYQNNVSN